MTVVPVYLIDTNVMVRFITGNHVDHSERSKALFESAKRGLLRLEIPFVAIVETFYVLTKTYKVEKKIAGNAILKLLNAKGIRLLAPNWIQDAINEYLSEPVSLADACIAAEARSLGHTIASFDRDFDFLKDVKRYEPR